MHSTVVVRDTSRLANLLQAVSEAAGTGIVVENLSKAGGLKSYMVTGNMATVEAKLEAGKRLVDGNL